MKLAAEPSCGPETFDDKALRLAAFGLVDAAVSTVAPHVVGTSIFKSSICAYRDLQSQKMPNVGNPHHHT